jgi:hypothetical protein
MFHFVGFNRIGISLRRCGGGGGEVWGWTSYLSSASFQPTSFLSTASVLHADGFLGFYRLGLSVCRVDIAPLGYNHPFSITIQLLPKDTDPLFN